MVRNHSKIKHMCFRGGAEASKPQTSTQKATGAAKWSETLAKISHMCFRGALKLESRKLPLKKPREQPNGQKPIKNQPYVL